MMRSMLRAPRHGLVAATVLAFTLLVGRPVGAGAQVLAVPPFDRGIASVRGAGPKVLGAADLAGIRAWLDAHRAGWRPNLATPPVADVTVSLGTSAQPSAVMLELWPAARDADWRNSVVVDDAAARSTRIQTLPAQDMAALLGLLR